MSLIRYGSTYEYVEGESEDYVFHSSMPKESEDFVEDYNQLSNETLVELALRAMNRPIKCDLCREYVMKKLAERLQVKLRKKPLTPQEAFHKTCEKVSKWSEEQKNEH